MAYVDFAYYTNTYGGVLIPCEAFAGCARDAGAYLDFITAGSIGEVTDAVKNAACAVCEALYKTAGREGIKSEGNDGVSVTYADGAPWQTLARAAAKLYLPPELLYRGVL